MNEATLALTTGFDDLRKALVEVIKQIADIGRSAPVSLAAE